MYLTTLIVKTRTDRESKFYRKHDRHFRFCMGKGVETLEFTAKWSLQKNYCSHRLSTHRPQESDLFLITSGKKKINQISSLKTTKEQSEITVCK